MRVVLQRVTEASVDVESKLHASIGVGYLILIGVDEACSNEDIAWLVQKIAQLRIFSDEAGKMNLSIQEVKGEFLVISQFTLFADCKKGNRPSFIRAAKPEIAIPLYEQFCKKLEMDSGCKVKTGVFGADMKVSLINDGPVTIVLDSKQKDF